MPCLVTTLMAGALAAAHAGGPAADCLAAGFRDVPMSARLRLFWRVFGPAWTSEEIDRQLEELRRVGVGGVMTCFTYPVALDDPALGIRNQRYLSPEFLATLRHAAERARQLGLEFGVCGGTGWPFGGPDVSLADAAQRLRIETMPLPADGSVALLPALREGERYLAAFVGDRDVTGGIQGDRLILRTADRRPTTNDERPTTNQQRPTAEVSHTWVVGPSSLVVFITGPTYMSVKRAALGGEGYVVDHLSREAVGRYLEAVVAPMLRAAPDGLIRTLFCDSLEVYRANWTGELAAWFRRRRGYDLLPRLPELFDETAPACRDLRFDFWRTVAELAEEEFARPVHEWCRRHGIAFALEPYGTPSVGFTGARYCDVPWGEQYEWKGFSFSRFAASAGHLTGKKIIGAEAWTWAGIPNRLADSLSDLKLLSDFHFLAGENELTGVDFPYSPQSAGVPGWTPYFGPVLGPNNPQWLCFPDLAAYVNRCQWLLRQGEPVADVALYTPTEDAFAHGPIDQMLLDFHLRDRLATGPLTDEFGLDKALSHHSDVVHTLLTHGYNFDGIDFFAVNALARTRGRRLVAGDGRYGIVVLPNLEGMDLAALEKLSRFCRAGGTLIATRRLPTRAYGARRPDATARLRTLVASLFGETDGSVVTLRPYGRGNALFTTDETTGLAEALARSGVTPDLRVIPDHPEVSHVHRHLPDRDLYFIVNASATEARFTADIRAKSRTASLWDPLTGEIIPLSILSRENGRTQVALTLPARGSTFVCLERGRAGSLGQAPTPTPGPSSNNGGGELLHRPSSPSPIIGGGGRGVGAHQLLPITSTWRVTFDGPDAPQPYETRTLTSWTTWPGGRFFSGRAVYTTRFSWPYPLPAGCRLRLEEVREVAVVQVNGHRAGSIWTPPYELEIGPVLRPGENALEITVANLPVNRVLGQPDPDLGPLRAAYGNRFPDPEEKRLMPEPAPSGLIGRVELLIEPDR